MDNDKYAFCSEQWVAVANQFLKDSAKGTDLSGIEYSFNEVFTNAPAELDPDEQGRVGWYIRVHDGQVEARRGILEDPDVCVETDYEAILPIARIVFADNPEKRVETQKLIKGLTEAGNFTRTVKSETHAKLPWMGQMHDVLARRTL